MHVLIEPQSADGGQAIVASGDVCRVGRSAPSELVCAGDSFLSGEHFAVDCSGSQCLIRDLGSRNGTFLNGAKVNEAVLTDGDCIVAGQTHFLIRIEEKAPPSGLPAIGFSELKEQHKRVLEVLRQVPEGLFALLDAARSDRILDLLYNSGEQYQSLYEGQQGRELDNWAPYLVKLPNESRLLLWLLREGWGKSWGVFLSCGKPFLEIRKHFRRFLLVQGENGRQLYFRFYDPRVLRLFLPTCTHSERCEFLGLVSSCLMEDEDPASLIEFTPEGLRKRNLNLSRLQGVPVTR